MNHCLLHTSLGSTGRHPLPIGWRKLLAAVAGLFLLMHSISELRGQARGSFELDLVDAQTGVPLDCRVLVLGPNGQPVRPRAAQSAGGWHLVEGKLQYRGLPGEYRYQVWRGLEYPPARGGFTLDKHSEASERLELPRQCDLAAEGWHGGDLLSRLSPEETTRWLAAEGLLTAASVSSDWGRVADRAAGLSYLDDRPGSGLVLHHWWPPAEVPADLPSSRLLTMAKQAPPADDQLPVHVEIQKMWARDLPIWLASGRVDSVQLLSEHVTYQGQGAVAVTPPVLPEGNFSGPRGPGRLVEQIYWSMLEAGLRIPPSAGSGFGRGNSPLGYNRVYTLIGSRTQLNWWQALRRGNSFVTNGPLLRVAINGQPPGHLFQADEAIELEIDLILSTAEPTEYVELVYNGDSLYRAKLDEFAQRGGRLPLLKIEQSGWLIVRVITASQSTYRLASTGAYYFEIAGQPRISLAAIEYFQRWLEAARQQIESLPAAVQVSHQPYLQAAERYWSQRQAQATVP